MFVNRGGRGVGGSVNDCLRIYVILLNGYRDFSEFYYRTV